MDEQVKEVEVVLWSPAGDLACRPLDAVVAVRFDDPDAIADLLDRVGIAIGSEVALRRLNETHAHVELADPSHANRFPFEAPDIAVPGKMPWFAPGWFARLRSVLPPGRLRLVKHWSISAIVTVETEAGTLWFKQVPPFMAHEGRLTQWLAELRPGSVPEVVAVGEDWSLTKEFPPPTHEEGGESPFGLLAELQLASSPRVDELLALGCPDRRLHHLAGEVAALCAREDRLEADQRDRLADAIPALQARVAALLDALPASMEATLVHGDLHSGNWSRRSDGSWIVFDWTDGAVSHPFMDLGVPGTPRDDYLRAWSEVVDAASLERAAELARPLGSCFQALSYARIIDGIGGDPSNHWKQVVGHFVTTTLEGIRA